MKERIANIEGGIFMWLIMAALSAFFAGVTAILAKCGIRHADSDVVTALRTVVVLAFSWVMVFITGSQSTLGEITPRSYLFLILSGAATGASWICYFRALSMADVNRVAPIDKSSTGLSVLLAILLLGETSHLTVKLAGVVLVTGGAILMVERHGQAGEGGKRGWMVYAVLSAVFAAATSILAKVGIAGVESNLGTAIRTCVVLAMAWLIVLGRGKIGKVREVSRREMGFIALSGVATGASWLCYYYAIQNGVVSVVVPIDRLSIVVTILFSRIALGERLGRRAMAGLVMMVAGALIMALWA